MLASIEHGYSFSFAEDLKTHSDCIFQFNQCDHDALLHSTVLNRSSFQHSKCKCFPLITEMPDSMLQLGSNDSLFGKIIEKQSHLT